jgi:succinate dehydrogenase hydrophobic anchor subunit
MVAGIVTAIIIVLLVGGGVGAVLWIKKNRPEMLSGPKD